MDLPHGRPTQGPRVFRAWEVVLAALILLGLFSLQPLRAAEPAPAAAQSGEPERDQALAEAERRERAGDLEGAIVLRERVLQHERQRLGAQHPDTVQLANDLAVLLITSGAFDRADGLLRQAESIRRRHGGERDPQLAPILSNLALVAGARGEFLRALSLQKQALALLPPTAGSAAEAALRLTLLANLAEIERGAGDPVAARPHMEAALAESRRQLGIDHSDTLVLMDGLGQLLIDLGERGDARAAVTVALEMRRRRHGVQHPHNIRSLNLLGLIAAAEGRPAEAERFHLEALALARQLDGPSRIRALDALGNLGMLMVSLGREDRAETHLLEGLALARRDLGPHHPQTGVLENNLAQLRFAQNRLDEAETLYAGALAIHRRILGADHPNSALLLANLALVRQRQGHPAEAERLLREALERQRRALAPQHPALAETLNNLGTLLALRGRPREGEPLLREALAIGEARLGAVHPAVARHRANLSWLLQLSGDDTAALAELQRGLSLETLWLTREAPLLPREARSPLVDGLGWAWMGPFSLLGKNPGAVDLAFESRLNRQGLLVEIEQRQAVLSQLPGPQRHLAQRLVDLDRRLSAVHLSASERQRLREQRAQGEQELFRALPNLPIPPVRTDQVAAVLPPDGVLVEFQRYHPFDAHRLDGERWGDPRYLALVLHPDGRRRAVPLGAAAPLDAAIAAGLRQTQRGALDLTAWSEVERRVLDPLQSELAGSRQWFLSPDGELHRVPFAALTVATGRQPEGPRRPLTDVADLRLIGSGRDLLRLRRPPDKAGAPLLIAAPRYGERPAARPSSQPTGKTDPPPTGPGASTAAQRRSGDLTGRQWDPLPGTAIEGRQLASLLNVSLVSGTAATAAFLQRQQRPLILHVATHGFFAPDRSTRPGDPLVAVMETSPLLKGFRGEDPMLRSGLVMAGANHPEADPRDDGYLTAAEVTAMDLRGTELVVLSACSTGQGVERTGEGVYGLQRAFQVAGARTTLLSLWKVDDRATASFMKDFYERLVGGASRSAALAATQQHFRRHPQAGYRHPYYWAGWQLVGDWQPIGALRQIRPSHPDSAPRSGFTPRLESGERQDKDL